MHHENESQVVGPLRTVLLDILKHPDGNSTLCIHLKPYPRFLAGSNKADFLALWTTVMHGRCSVWAQHCIKALADRLLLLRREHLSVVLAL